MSIVTRRQFLIRLSASIAAITIPSLPTRFIKEQIYELPKFIVESEMRPDKNFAVQVIVKWEALDKKWYFAQLIDHKIFNKDFEKDIIEQAAISWKNKLATYH